MPDRHVDAGTSDLLRPGEAEKLLGVTRRTLMRWTKAGHIRAIRLPSGHRRFRRSDVLALRDGME